MESLEIFKQLTEIIREVLNNHNLTLTPETAAADLAEWDSFNHINIVVAAELHFGIKFKTAELEQLRNIGEFVKLIERKQQAKQR